MEHYKAVLAQTESMLTSLQASPHNIAIIAMIANIAVIVIFAIIAIIVLIVQSPGERWVSRGRLEG